MVIPGLLLSRKQLSQKEKPSPYKGEVPTGWGVRFVNKYFI